MEKPLDKKPEKKKSEPKPQASLLLWMVVALVSLWFWQEVFVQSLVTTIPYSEFKQKVQSSEVVRCQIRETEIIGQIQPEGKGEDDSFSFRTVRVEDPELVKQLTEKDVTFLGKRPGMLSNFLANWVLPLLLLFMLWSFLARRFTSAGSSLLAFGKSKARLVADKDTGVSFQDVAGCDEAKAEMEEVVDFLKNSQRYTKLGARIPKGVLLVGPPGTGKTLLARAVAGQAGVPFFSLSGSDFVEMFVGVGASRVRDLFQQAKKAAPCIVFIDELDAIGRERGVRLGTTNDEREQTLNQLLVEMDGFESNTGVILMAATNRPEVLDRALLRPGRFDRQVLLDAPDSQGRQAILRVHSRGKPLDAEVDLGKVARITPGFTGADLANALNEAALLAARRKQETIDQKTLLDAVEKVVAGPERKSRRLSDEERERVAYHEVGHALVALNSEHAEPVHKISIVPRGRGALGYTLQLPREEKFLSTRAELMDRLRVLLGGRAAEQIVYKEVSTGAENDLERATLLARQMVCLYGMSETVGLAQSGRRAGSFLDERGQLSSDCSPETAALIDREVRELLAQVYQEAQDTLTSRRETLEKVSLRLMEVETMEREELMGLVEP